MHKIHKTKGKVPRGKLWWCPGLNLSQNNSIKTEKSKGEGASQIAVVVPRAYSFPPQKKYDFFPEKQPAIQFALGVAKPYESEDRWTDG